MAAAEAGLASLEEAAEKDEESYQMSLCIDSIYEFPKQMEWSITIHHLSCQPAE